MKWILFRVLVTYFHWKAIRAHGYSIKSCWDYSGSFDNFFEDAQWLTIISDAKFSVMEDFTNWT